MNTLDERLKTAGARLRADAPDSVATAQAYRRRHDQPLTPAPEPTRSWWPTIVGFGLVTSAIVGVVAVRSIGQEADVLVPTDSVTPETTLDTLAPQTTIAATTTTTTTTTPASAADDVCGPTPITVEEGFGYDVLNCRGGDDPTALVAQFPIGGGFADATRWFTTASAFSPGVELANGTGVLGLDNAEVFAVEVNGTSCTVLADLRPLGDWREICGAAPGVVITPWNGNVVRIDFTDPTAVTATEVVDPIGGCDRMDIDELATETGMPGALFTAVGCDGETAAISIGSVFTQPGTPDGGIFVYAAEDDGSWTLVDSGTDVGDVPLTEIP